MRRGLDEAPPEADCVDGAPHPRLSHKLFGHAAAERDILDAYRSGRLPHAIMLGGPQGIGKATLAWRVAKFILAHPDPGSPGVQGARDLSVAADNPAVRRVEALSHGDVALLRRQWNDKAKRHFTEIRIDEVRDALHLFQRASGAGGYRICIVDSADELNRNSANALLKMVEEPPEKSLFLIVAHAPARQLATLRSRCRKIMLEPLDPADVVAAVQSLGAPWWEMSPQDVTQAALAAHGSVGEALAMLGGDMQRLHADLAAILARLPDVDWRAVHRLASTVSAREAGASFEAMVALLLDHLDAKVREEGAALARLVPYAETWEKLRADARVLDAYNLDKRAFVITAFADLAAAARKARGASLD